MPPTTDLNDRARGALLGHLIGDALGTTVEFLDAPSIALRHPAGLRDLIGGGPFHLDPGQVTDDGELALALARTLVTNRSYVPDRVAQAYVDWLRSKPFDVGNTIRQAFAVDPAPAVGLAERMAATASTSSQANGAMMRVAPLCVFGHRLQPESLAELTDFDCSLSHPHEVCRHANVAYGFAVAGAVRGRDIRAIYDTLLDFGTGMAMNEDVMEVLFASPQRPPDDYQRQMGWVLIAVHNAMYQAFNAPTFEAGLVDTVGRGGDSDTNGCIAGALLGALHGAAAIPARWIDTLLGCRTDRGPTYQTTDAIALADALVEAAPDTVPINPGG